MARDLTQGSHDFNKIAQLNYRNFTCITADIYMSAKEANFISIM